MSESRYPFQGRAYLGILILFLIINGCKTEAPITKENHSRCKDKSQCKDELIKMLHGTVHWKIGGLERTSGRMPSGKDAEIMYTKLTDADIPLLVEIIHENRIDPAEIAGAGLVLSRFTDKALPIVKTMLEKSSSPQETNNWLMVLDQIQIRKQN
ncbi:MAG: hypothetical protein ACXVCY_19590 [Pseudobdellovibrionaceae bacterium]